MGRTTNHFKIGLFILGGICLLAVGIVAFGARRLLERKSSFETYVDTDVAGLAVGSSVELRGVQVGRVTSIDFSWNKYIETQPSYVVVVFEMRDDVLPLPLGQARTEMIQAAVKRGLRARVKAKGITGACILSIEYLIPTANPPAQFPWTPKHAYIPAAPGQFGELLALIEKSLHNIEQLDFGMINRELEVDLKSVGDVLEQTRRMNLGALGTNANSLLTELRVSNKKLESLVGDVQEQMGRVNLGGLSTNANSLLSELRSSNKRLETLIEDTDGTVNKIKPGLANLDFDGVNQTLVSARRAFKDVDDTVVELKRYPSGFLFGKPPQPIKEVQSAGK